ncbi:histidine phosphatase family protein [Thermoanaerobacterium thermosaccharolyticum]|uniref:Fructose-2,6-bisphosphatase n=1 Tax=Thermoanaerobacterium thermosaccharolyticum M0795 TaxID=698948 RepID=L0IJN4_THETR|nr:histidine phosphatase family protein [Thermoanaerobacterium thermosaccharolyticum]AGB18964.1 fructose-2,6-bisphosphatase [Thermoanaerobacterium thermosaccharolyticum M0795]
MSTRLFIVRHGETSWNKLKKIQGISNVDLTDEGVKQAYLLSQRLKHEKIDVIFSSDLDRAYKTASLIAKEFDLDVIKLQEFREISFGVWEGLTIGEIEKLYKDLYYTWRTNPSEAIIDGAETLEAVQKRILSMTYKIVEQYKNKNILIVSHGTSIKALILGLLNLDLSFYPKIRQDNTALNIIDIKDDGNCVLVLLNDTCHLRSENN